MLTILAIFMTPYLTQTEAQTWIPVNGIVSFSDIQDIVPPLARMTMGGITIEFQAKIINKHFHEIETTKHSTFPNSSTWMPKVVAKITLNEPDTSIIRDYKYIFRGVGKYHVYVRQQSPAAPRRTVSSLPKVVH